MIQRSDILSIPFLDRSTYTGSHQGMRYRIEKSKTEEDVDILKCFIWPGPYGYDVTPAEEKQAEEFPFSEEGICQIVDWLNENWSGQKDRWMKAKNNW